MALELDTLLILAMVAISALGLGVTFYTGRIKLENRITQVEVKVSSLEKKMERIEERLFDTVFGTLLETGERGGSN